MPSDAPKNPQATVLVNEASKPPSAITNPAPIQMMAFAATCGLLCRSRSGLYKLIENDPTFPRPLKDSDARTARAFFVAAEIAEWQRCQLESRQKSISKKIAPSPDDLACSSGS